jgi:hypothetical protein
VMREQCRDCRFWLPRKDFTEERGGGYCRRYPPAFMLENTLNDGWPNVHQYEWCGEYQRRYRTDVGTMRDIS